MNKQKNNTLFVILAIIAFCGLSCIGHCQTTAVTATITDSDSIVWTNAQWNINFRPVANYPNLNSYNINGIPITNASSPCYGLLNQSGTSNNTTGLISVTLCDNSLISPSGSTYNITVQPQASSAATQYPPVAVSGSSESLTSFLSSNAIAPRFPATGANQYGYTTAEINTTPVPGGFFFNVTSGVQQTWNGTTWVSSGGGGSGTVTPSPQYTVFTQPNSGSSATATGNTNLTTDAGGDFTATGNISASALTVSGTNGLSIGGPASTECPASYGTYYICAPSTAINLYTEIRAHPDYLSSGLKDGVFGCSGSSGGDLCFGSDIPSDLQNEFQVHVNGTLDWTNGTLTTQAGLAQLVWEGPSNLPLSQLSSSYATCPSCYMGIMHGQMQLEVLGAFSAGLGGPNGANISQFAPVHLRAGTNANLLLNPSGGGTGITVNSVDDTDTNTYLYIQAPIVDLDTPNAAISGTNYSSPSFYLSGSYWNGSASANDFYSLFDSVGATATNPNTFLELTHTGSSGAVGFVINSPITTYMYGADTISNISNATSSTNYSSPHFTQEGSYWNGSAAATDTWISLDQLGTGSNPTSTLSITHTGTTGYSSVNVPALTVASSRKGTFVCTVGGTITISNTNELITSDVIISLNTAGGTITTAPAMKTVTGGTGFTVLCGATDTSTYNYDILN